MKAFVIFLGFAALIALDVVYFDANGVRSFASMIGPVHAPTD